MNVFGFLARAYTGGEVPSPSAMTTLSGRTLHSLYAVSFIVYTVNLGADWASTYYACQGWTLSFPMRPWLVMLMVSCCCAGSVLTFLLLVLCVESAFKRGLDFDPYRTGFLMIWEKCSRWVVGFSCFRVAFLVLLLQDAPMSVVNLGILSACRLPNPALAFWPLVLVGLAKLLSISWRILMLLYAYKHFWAARLSPRAKLSDAVCRESTSLDELKTLVGLEPERLGQYDECWPLRWSLWRFWARDRREAADAKTLENHYNAATPNATAVTFHTQPSVASRMSGVGRQIGRAGLNSAGCCCSCVGLYAALCLSCCVPCIGHYGCRKNANQYRHRFARSCTRLLSTCVNCFLFFFSAFLSLTLLIVNGVWLSSVQVIGHNSLPPELTQTCVRIDVRQKTFQPILLPYLPHTASNQTHVLDCKPIFEQGDESWGFAWSRRKPTPWQKVEVIGDTESSREFLTMWLDLELPPNAAEGGPEPVLFYDFLAESAELKCGSPESFGWRVLDGSNVGLPWPYFRGCVQRYSVRRRRLLSCNSTRVDPALVHKSAHWWQRNRANAESTR